MHGKGFISIWFFIGVLLTAYGVLITASGFYELVSPPAHAVVLANLHAGIWWGARVAGHRPLLYDSIFSKETVMSTINDPCLKVGLIVGNRGFFPDHLAATGREEMIRVLEESGIEVVALTPEESKFGAVETFEEAKRCAELFKRHRESIDGVIVTLPNFGDERGIADTLRRADLNVPVLVQATPDTPGKMTIADRRDSFCGKMSACNNLRQYRIPYSLTTLHTEAPTSPEFAKDLLWFMGVCRVVRGMRNLRIGAIGARPAAFNTVRYSEKILEENGISTITIDLSEILGRIDRMKDDRCRRRK